MSFFTFKQIPISLNNDNLVIESLELSQNIELSPTFYIDNIISPSEQPNSMWKGNLKIQYYLTGADPLKMYMYSDELDPISGYIAGLGFSQGFLSNYSIDIQPNSPVMVNATIDFFDQLTGTLSPSTQISNTGFILRTSDVQINNLQGYTQNILNNIIKAKFDYSCKWIPSYNYYDSGISPTKADYVSINERTTEVSVTSDNTNFTIPLSGENFRIIFTFDNPTILKPINLIPNNASYVGFSSPGNYSLEQGTQANDILERNTLYYIIFGNNEDRLYNPYGSPTGITSNGNGSSSSFRTSSFFDYGSLSLYESSTGLLGYPVTAIVYNQLTSAIYETLGISGKLHSKTLNISTNKHHTHELQISNKRLLKEGGIQNVSVQTSTEITYGQTGIRLNPIMNSDVLPYGKVSASYIVDSAINQKGNGELITPAYYAFDNNNQTTWFLATQPRDPTVNGILTYQFPIPTLITGISFIEFKNTNNSVGQFDAFALQRSNDGIHWDAGNVLIPSLSNTYIVMDLTSGALNTFPIYNTGYYSYYTFYILNQSFNFPPCTIGITEMSLIGDTNYNLTGYINILTINSTTNTFPFLSNDGSISYVKNIVLGDTYLTGWTINRTTNYDQIVVPALPNSYNNNLVVETSYGNFYYNNLVQLNFAPISILGFYPQSGNSNTSITIYGNNFNRITDVLFGGISSTFQILNSRTILAVAPSNGISGPITVISQLQNLTGISSNNFYFNPQITYTSPVTGQWKDFIDIGGTNFTGTTSVYFNNSPAYNWYLLSNNIISAQTPETGQPYPLGYIYIYGSGGSTQSLSIYNPIVPIYGLYPNSGWDGSGIAILTKIDTGYLCPFSGGYKSRIGDIDTPVYISGNNSTGILTGIIPTGAVSDYVFLYAPDGIRTYVSPQILNINGIPVVESVSPSILNAYQPYNLVVNGQSLQYFDSNSFIAFYGHDSGNFLTFNTGHLVSQVGGNSLLANNIIITGAIGYYDVIVKNIYGSGVLNNGIFVQGGNNLAPYYSNAINQYGFYPNTLDPYDFSSPPSFYLLPAYNAINGSTNDFAVITCTNQAGGPPGVIQTHLSFSTNRIIDIANIQFIINQGVPNPEIIGFFGWGEKVCVQQTSGFIAFYRTGNNTTPVYITPLINFSGGFQTETPISGVGRIEMFFIPFFNGYNPGNLPYNPSMFGNYSMGINEMLIFGSIR